MNSCRHHARRKTWLGTHFLPNSLWPKIVQVEQAILLMTFSPKELQFNEFRGFSKTIKKPFDLLSGICGRLQVFDGVLRVFVGVLRVKLVVGFHQILSPKPRNNIKCFPLHVGLQRSQPGHEQTNVFINFSFVVVTSMYLLYIESSLPLAKDELIATL